MTELASIQRLAGQRVQFDSPLPFAEVVGNFRGLIGTASMAEPPGPKTSLGEQYGDAMDRIGGPSQAAFEEVVRGQLGDSEFMLFHQIDHSEWLPVYGIARRVLRLTFGNPIIAITLMRDDLTAGLFAPVEILIVEDDNGKGCRVVYMLPSSMVASANPTLLPAARELDKKLAALVSRATGVPAPFEQF